MRKFIFLFLFSMTIFYSCNEDNADSIVLSKQSEYYKSPEFFAKSLDKISNDLIENTVSYRSSSTYELTY